MNFERTSSCLDLFMDRDDQRQVLADYFGNLVRRENAAPKILCVHGAGGVGKTTLLEKAVSELDSSEKKTAPERKLLLARVDLDDGRVDGSLPATEFLFRLRNGVKLASDKAKTPLFDYVYLAYLNQHLPGQQFTLPDTRPLRRAEGWLNGFDAFRELVEIAALASGVVFPSIAGISNVAKLFSGLHDWYERSCAQERFGGKPESWTPLECVERMPAVLAMDLQDWRKNHPDLNCCVVVDGFERVQTMQSTSYAADAQNALRSLIEKTEDLPGVGWIVVGRNKLVWAEQRLTFALLEGLSGEHARTYLEQLANRRGLATSITKHTDAVLSAACEQDDAEAVEDREPTYLPYVLNLAVSVIATEGDCFKPEMLGGSRREMEGRFLQALSRHDRSLLDAIKVLALAVTFDKALFRDLIGARHLNGVVQDFQRLTGSDHWFVQADPSCTDSFRFHRHMQECLVQSQTGHPGERKAASEVVEWLLERHAEDARFETPSAFSPSCLSAYVRAMELLKMHAANGIISVDDYGRWFTRLDPGSGFDKVTAATTRERFHRWRVEYLCKRVGESDVSTLSAMGELADLLSSNGDLHRARSLLEDTVLRSAKLGENDPRALAWKSQLGWACGAVGEVARARALLEQALDAQQRMENGAEHTDTMTSMDRLGVVLQAQGHLRDARSCHETVFEARRRQYGALAPQTLESTSHLASTLSALGDYAKARELQEKVLEIRVRDLGSRHAYTLAALNELSITMLEQGDFEGACSQLRTVVEARLEDLGDKHPDTLRSKRDLASTLNALGDARQACELQHAVVTAQRRVLGPKHPETLISITHWASSLRGLGDLVTARQLAQDALDIQLQQSHADHPSVLMTKHRLAWIFFASNESERALSLLEEVREAWERTLGAEHPSTAYSMRDVAATMLVRGNFEGARMVVEACLHICRSVIGHRHPQTLMCLVLLARALYQQGRNQLASAISNMEVALAGLSEVMGAGHGNTVAAQRWLGDMRAGRSLS